LQLDTRCAEMENGGTALTEMREAVAPSMTRAAEQGRRAQPAAGVLAVLLTTSRCADEPQYATSMTIPLPVATRTPPS
jgi:hypothetical protein